MKRFWGKYLAQSVVYRFSSTLPVSLHCVENPSIKQMSDQRQKTTNPLFRRTILVQIGQQQTKWFFVSFNTFRRESQKISVSYTKTRNLTSQCVLLHLKTAKSIINYFTNNLNQLEIVTSKENVRKSVKCNKKRVSLSVLVSQFRLMETKSLIPKKWRIECNKANM